MCAPTLTPFSASSCLAIAPAKTSGAVILPRSEVYEDGRLLPVEGVPPLEKTIAEAILALKADPARAAAMSAAGPAAAARCSPQAYYRTLLTALEGWRGH